MFRTLFYAIVVIGLAAAGFAVFQNDLAAAYVDSVGPRASELLEGASQDDPDAAVAFHRQFPEGSSETQLRAWLSAEHFEIREGAEGSRSARRDYIRGHGCEEYRIYWYANSNRTLRNLRVYGGESSCI